MHTEDRADLQDVWREFVAFCERRHMVADRAIIAAMVQFTETDPEAREELILRTTGEKMQAGEVSTLKIERAGQEGDQRLKTGIVARIS